MKTAGLHQAPRAHAGAVIPGKGIVQYVVSLLGRYGGESGHSIGIKRPRAASRRNTTGMSLGLRTVVHIFLHRNT